MQWRRTYTHRRIGRHDDDLHVVRCQQLTCLRRKVTADIVSLTGDQHLTKPQMSAFTGRVRLCVSSVLPPPHHASTDLI